ncbi:hypothetical protein [Methanobrevibacter sp.]|uniref:hypothetical protein n=1 Tax=Methanobrevibacter sp. TaxID=66852 RepID=UPI00388FCCDF
MDMKNTAILLILLLAVLGLIIGVQYTEADIPAKDTDNSESFDYGESNGEITITLDVKEKNESLFDKLFS